MMKSWNRNTFFITGPLWGEPLITSGFPSQRVNNTDVFWLLAWTNFEEKGHIAEYLQYLNVYEKSL